MSEFAESFIKKVKRLTFGKPGIRIKMFTSCVSDTGHSYIGFKDNAMDRFYLVI